MVLDYLLIDVFSDRPLGGSRLTFFPRAEGLEAGTMQDLAREMGCGETAFAPLGGAGEGAEELEGPRQLRVFTPTVEIPFAGHAVLGATFALDHLGLRDATRRRETAVWSLESGPAQVLTGGEADAPVYSLIHERPVFLGQYFNRAKVARTLGLPESEIAITGLPCEIVSTGLPVHVVPVGSLDAVESISLNKREADGIARDLGFGDLFVFTCETVSPEATVHCRMFAPYFGIPEDPASGAATGALAAYLVKHRLVKFGDRLEFTSEQGLEMRRPSRLTVEADVEEGRAVRIRVGGRCVLVGEGRIRLA
jgi:trans-2,3-dihydro-3-hydroxyanthranilate isomerase